MGEQRRFWRDCADAQARLNFAARIGDKPNLLDAAQTKLAWKILLFMRCNTDRSKAVLLLWFLTVLAVCVYTLVHLLC